MASGTARGLSQTRAILADALCTATYERMSHRYGVFLVLAARHVSTVLMHASALLSFPAGPVWCEYDRV